MPVDPAFAELLADKRSELRAPPSHVSVAALRWIADHATDLNLAAERFALCGDSAGANLAAASALRARRDGPDVRHVALLYPMLDPACDTESMHVYGRGHLLARGGVQWSWSQYLGAPDDAVNLLVALRDCRRSRRWQRRRSTT